MMGEYKLPWQMTVYTTSWLNNIIYNLSPYSVLVTILVPRTVAEKYQRWEFIKEKSKKIRKHAYDQEKRKTVAVKKKKKESTLSTKKARFEKNDIDEEKEERK